MKVKLVLAADFTTKVSPRLGKYIGIRGISLTDLGTKQSHLFLLDTAAGSPSLPPAVQFYNYLSHTYPRIWYGNNEVDLVMFNEKKFIAIFIMELIAGGGDYGPPVPLGFWQAPHCDLSDIASVIFSDLKLDENHIAKYCGVEVSEAMTLEERQLVALEFAAASGCLS